MDQIARLLNDLKNRIERIEKGLVIAKITTPSNGFYVPKVLTTDPATPQANEIWINSTSKQLKWNNGGTIQYIQFS